ncbi:N-acetylmuramoyl-L-alanine amidase [Agrobacterium phage OLIVR5]|uniref:N-acetylmuramoyl-L-alanine amidase n=1 Tax=Agrobacterium phage OLIVR5 TaxID=2723773 RepID=A0A858MSV2_9CAUD|nr:amidase [Agrobacterium phage OLIVR5]QIW87679.1 N-acetylmuramoyl-L-alanine amidase [Agrobacterium phage OLIVR5]QIW87941.1 N-acetylmuramoyl-L-alanine amidase [Agrobacterium phage OLIVR6]
MKFEVKNGKLEGGLGVAHLPTTKKGKGVNTKKFIVLHYTAGNLYKDDVALLSSGKAEVSCHLVVGPKGEVTQIGGFDDVQWHAGKSAWKGVSNLNGHSIGIEITNPGYLKPVPGEPGKYAAHFGKKFDKEKDGLILAKQKDVGSDTYGWLPYTPEQFAAVEGIVRALQAQFKSIEEVVGHEQISPGRKQDPAIGIILPLDFLELLNSKETPAQETKPDEKEEKPNVEKPETRPAPEAKPETPKEEKPSVGPAYAKRRVVNAPNGLRIRRSMSTSGQQIGSLKNGEEIETLWRPSGWLELKQGGYVALRFTEVIS